MVVRYPHTTLPRLVLTVLTAGVVTGIEGDLRATVTALLKQHQPKAVAFNGCVVKGGAAQNKSTCITPNALRWIGSHPASATIDHPAANRHSRAVLSSAENERMILRVRRNRGWRGAGPELVYGLQQGRQSRVGHVQPRRVRHYTPERTASTCPCCARASP